MGHTSGKKAWGLSDRSGFRYKLRDMKTEWNGAKVGPDEFEKKHPQLNPRRVPPEDQSLKDPRPDAPEGLRVYVWKPLPMYHTLTRPRMVAQTGQATVVIS